MQLDDALLILSQLMALRMLEESSKERYLNLTLCTEGMIAKLYQTLITSVGSERLMTNMSRALPLLDCRYKHYHMGGTFGSHIQRACFRNAGSGLRQHMRVFADSRKSPYTIGRCITYEGTTPPFRAGPICPVIWSLLWRTVLPWALLLYF